MVDFGSKSGLGGDRDARVQEPPSRINAGLVGKSMGNTDKLVSYSRTLNTLAYHHIIVHFSIKGVKDTL